MKILIVDDSKTMRIIIKGALSKGGYGEILEAENGKKAVSAVMDNADIDVILMDWNMPEMSGLDAVKAIRAGGHTSPILMVTTEAEKHRIVEAIQAGVNDYLVKPFTPDALIEKVKKHATVSA